MDEERYIKDKLRFLLFITNYSGIYSFSLLQNHDVLLPRFAQQVLIVRLHGPWLVTQRHNFFAAGRTFTDAILVFMAMCVQMGAQNIRLEARFWECFRLKNSEKGMLSECYIFWSRM